MHFVVSWDLKSSGEKWTEQNEKMKAVLKPYSWVRPLSTFYIVKVNGQSDWDLIRNNLTAVSESENKINFVMTPLMSGGSYNGMLPSKTWADINERSK